jgi:hypothetical protein
MFDGSSSYVVMLFSIFMIASNLLTTISHTSYAFEDQKPNIVSAEVYQNQKMILGNNVKNLVIVIPNEAHETTGQPKNQLPLINQPYLSDNVVVNRGIEIIWFNADVGHVHHITLNSNDSNETYSSSPFAFNTSSAPLTISGTGQYAYFEENVNKDVPSFVMRGTITAEDFHQHLFSINNTSSEVNSVGAYMIPKIYLDKYVKELNKQGLMVDTMYSYKDLRGGQKGTGPEQTLVIWTSSETNMDKVISALRKITPTLPYSWLSNRF